MDEISLLRSLAAQYNNPIYFENDPIIFPKYFYNLYKKGECSLQDIEIAAIISAHLAWGRRDMIVRDCKRAFEEMEWHPFQYIFEKNHKCDNISLHRTIKWSDFSQICTNLKNYYSDNASIESLSADEIRVNIYGQKKDPSAANKKIHMLRRWMVRNDGIVDLGIWENINPSELIIPLDVHVFRSAKDLRITSRNSCDYKTAMEITQFLRQVFPKDPALGDFALFAYSVMGNRFGLE
jgi:uncharacterized protein (TIGR02757 family)